MGIIHPTRKATQEHIVSGEVSLDGSNPRFRTRERTFEDHGVDGEK